MMRLWLLLLCSVISLSAWSNSGATEERMLEITTELRCLVCQNESIAASRSDFAGDIRKLIRGQIKAGKSDAEIETYLVTRYGDFILYRPPLRATTLLLWFGPMLLLVFGFLIFGVTLRRRKRSAVDISLSDEEQKIAEALLGQTTHHGNLS
ncbi:cytochrome c-type biogenesis protein [Bordetella petrii]|uniref:Cytochrome c-type biogenesis protein n=1 Tax=Bordetella petrii (strain ATCC BAA-461 / DSM 12804 / CCUG 43448 / CIP 107267 / Se-1111R) TaxID=340100 RepID=A9I314_BORPD|nr:cytochrome c-type biogenesis protein [Bordetella petrii]CAP44119.1 Cytochrome C-type biogenesis protein [Bordetella petrii]